MLPWTLGCSAATMANAQKAIHFATGNRTRVSGVRILYPDRLDYSELSARSLRGSINCKAVLLYL